MREPPSAAAALVAEEHRDATVMPLTPYPRPRRPHTYRFGVFDRQGRIVRESLLFRSYGRHGFPAEFAPASRVDPRSVVFGGHLSGMFGHFLLEGLSRLWYAREHPDLPIVWVGWAAQPAPAYRRWQRDLLEVLEIHNEAIFLNEPTRFRRVHVPRAGYRIKDWCSDQQTDFLAAYPARERDPDLKIWLSRAEADADLGSTFAFRLDRQLAIDGWCVVRPEKLPIREQLELLARATRVAGEEGSAFHLLALLADVNGLEIDIIGRRPDRTIEEQNGNYATIAEARRLDQRLHVVPEERTLWRRGRYVRKTATTTAGHLEIAGISRLTTIAAKPPGPARSLVTRVAAAAGAASYLEIGAGADALHSDPAVPVRDMVRPAFATDPRQDDRDGQQLYEMPPDEFFDLIADPQQPYDVIYVDAPGEPELLWRWFVAGRRYSHESTIWILRGADDRLAADVGALLRSTTISTPDGACVLLYGPAADVATAEEAASR
jgi:hypothetical protein